MEWDPRGEARQALQAIVDGFGIQVLQNGDLLASMLRDYLPNLPREANLLTAAVRTGAVARLSEDLGKLGMEPAATVAMAAAMMERTAAVDPAGARWSAAEYARLLGHPIPGPLPGPGIAGTMSPSAFAAPSMPPPSMPPPSAAGTPPPPAPSAPPAQPPTATYQAPGYQPPGYQPQNYQPPGYQGPGYQSAGYQGPGYQGAGYQGPGFQQPAPPAGYQQPPPGYPAVSGQRRKRNRAILVVAAVLVVLIGGGVAVAATLGGGGPATGAACLPGTWKLTASTSTISNTAYGTITLHYLSGTQTWTFHSKGGSITVSDFAQQADLPDGTTIRLVENGNGPGSFTYKATGSRISYGTLTIPGTIAVYRDGTEISAATEQTIATATPDRFSCSANSLTRRGPGYSFRYARSH